MAPSAQPPHPPRLTSTYGPIGMLVLSAVSLGLATALTKIALEQVTPVDLFGVEVVVSAVPLVALALARGARPSRPNPLLLLLGVLEPGLAYLLFDLGVQRTAASHAALLVALDAPVTLALAAVFLRERVDRTFTAALVLGMAGTALVSRGGGGAGTSVIGDLLVIAATVSAAAFTVLARSLVPERDPVVVTALQLLGALLVAAPVFAGSLGLGASSLAQADAAHLALAVAVGLLGGVVPFLLFNAAIGRVSATRASLVLVLVPVIGATASVVVVHERLTGLAVAGGTLALVGAVVAGRRDDLPPAAAPDPAAVTVGAPDPGWTRAEPG